MDGGTAYTEAFSSPILTSDNKVPSYPVPIQQSSTLICAPIFWMYKEWYLKFFFYLFCRQTDLSF